MNNNSICPHCKRKLELPNNSVKNVLAFDKSFALSKTGCCGKGVILRPIRGYEVFKYNGIQDKDDWGRKLNKQLINNKNKTI